MDHLLAYALELVGKDRLGDDDISEPLLVRSDAEGDSDNHDGLGFDLGDGITDRERGAIVPLPPIVLST